MTPRRLTSSALVLAALVFVILAGPAAGTTGEGTALTGTVASASGVPLEHAKVALVRDGETAATTFTDARGRFTLPGCEPPCLVLVTHPRFEEQAITLAELDGAIEIALTAKQALYERIDVTATRGGGGFAPVSIASTVIEPDDRPAAPSTLTELVEGAPGVSENGQGGLFQVFSIRGVSRHRVLTLVSGMPITGERRAGVSTSFIDPLLIGSVDVLRGPSSTYYGSGALGGVVQVFPRAFESWTAGAGWSSFGDETYQHAGWGDADRGLSVGIAHRAAGDGEDARGGELNSEFRQLSAAIQKSWQENGRRWELLAVPSLGRDIGKPNTDFPDRVTDYPREHHLLVKLGVASDAGWDAHVFIHPNDLETEVLRRGRSFTEVTNESFDLGASWQQRWSLAGGAGRPGGAGGLSGQVGVDYFGRRGVDSRERVEDLRTGEIEVLQTLDGARQDELAAFATARWSWRAATFQAGSRLTFQEQENAGLPSRDDSAWTGFLGLVQPLGDGFELTANLGTGLRFPNLSERFFTGTTGRGGVVGNPDLEPESSFEGDLGVRWYGARGFVAAQVFRLEVDDYVERVEVTDDLLSFVNLASGTIRGVEIEGFYEPAERWLMSWSGHLLEGEDDAGGALADVSPDRLELGLSHRRERLSAQLRLQLRSGVDEPGPGENAISGAELISASVGWRLTPELELTLRGRNLLDEEYRNSADDKASLMPGRSLGLSLSWTAL